MVRVTVGVPVYNEGAFIEQTLRSLANQTYSDFVVIVSDNASTDETSEICETFCRHRLNFRYIRHAENQGATQNFSYCIDNAESEFFMWLGGHDLISEGFLANAVELLGDEGLSIAGGVCTYIDLEGKQIQTSLHGSKRYSIPDNQLYSDNREIRLLQSVTYLKNYAIINYLFRRQLLVGQPLQPIAGFDAYLLYYMLWHGNVGYVPSERYYRRLRPLEQESSEAYMERVTGSSGQERDVRPMIRHTLEHFKPMLYRRGWRGIVLYQLISACLFGRYVSESSFRFRYRLLRSLVPEPAGLVAAGNFSSSGRRCDRDGAC